MAAMTLVGLALVIRRRQMLGPAAIAGAGVTVKTSKPWLDVGDDMDVHEWAVDDEDEIDGVELRSRYNPKHYALAHRATTGGRWQVTEFDEHGPVGDSRRKTLQEALEARANPNEYEVVAVHTKRGRGRLTGVRPYADGGAFAERIDDAKERPDFFKASLARVQDAAAKLVAEGNSFGGRKVFISDIAKRLGTKPERIAGLLLVGQNQGWIRLARADLVGALDPKKTAASEVETPFGGTVHFVVVD